jgi:hypothetical protein
MTATQNHVDPHLHLFLDDAEIHQIYGLRRVVNRPARRSDPVLAPTMPWEQGCRTQAWGSVVAEPDGLLRMWYMVFNARKDPGTEANGGFAYAESRDGIHWEKPALGLVEWRGSKENNYFLTFGQGIPVADEAGRPAGLVTGMDGLTVVRDDQEPDPDRRYKLIGNMQNYLMWARYHGPLDTPDEEIVAARAVWGQYMLTSPDGLHWSREPQLIRRVQGGDYMMVVRDYRHRRWWMNERCRMERLPGFGGARTAGLATSDDLVHWSEHNEMTFVLNTEEGYGTLRQHHGMTPFAYGDLDLGFLELWSVAGQGNWVELTCHRDGQPWQRVLPTERFLDIGPERAFDRVLAYPTHNPPVRLGDRLLIFYSGLGRDPVTNRLGHGAIGLATLGRDRFVSLSRFRHDEPGGIVTRPMAVTGPLLQVNVESFGGGVVRAAVKRPDWSAIPGYTLDDCVPISGDEVRYPVRWRTKADLAELLGQAVVLHFSVNEASLYGYRFGHDAADAA